MTKKLTLALALTICGCATDPRDIGREPHMSAIGSGLTQFGDDIPTGALKLPPPSRGLRFDDSRINLFRDVRAMSVGDLVTINISMDDKAVLGNSTDRSRDAKVTSKWQYLLALVPGLLSGSPVNGSGTFTNEIDSSTSTQGQGSINRSEQIRLSIAATVTAVLPNGNFVVQGSQEFRVNYEMRVLTIGGIVRPRDISRENTVPYDKIAEARISYGGRGRLMEVQQPAWGQQLYDLAWPF
ncbi:MAG: flagellar basal body L-ring protein FlgH [Methylocystis sp.]|jgi:flagellar L-ring protein precursor FlgH